VADPTVGVTDHRCTHQLPSGDRCVNLAEFDVATAGSPIPTCAHHLAFYVSSSIGDDPRGIALVADHIHPVPDV